MKAMILAAGRGERLRPLTDHTPKPLLKVGGRALIEYTIEALVAAGFSDLVINVAHLGYKIKAVLGDGELFDATIRYSDEGTTGLETAGGIIHALPLLGGAPFLVVNGDIATEFPYQLLYEIPPCLAHLILVSNPPYNKDGDFTFKQGVLSLTGKPRYTFSGIGVYDPNLFSDCQPGKRPLAPLLFEAVLKQQVTAQIFDGFWMDVGTEDRMQKLDAVLS